MGNRFVSLTALLLIVSGATPALGEENGIKIGDGRLHPFIDLEARYNTAALLDAATLTPVSDGIGYVRPGIRLAIPSSTLDVSLDASAEYLAYLGLVAPVSRKLNRLQAQAALDVAILKGSMVSVEIGDRFSRSDRTQNPSLSTGALSLFNDLFAGFLFTPGGGALTIRPQYHFVLENYSPLATGATAAGLNTLNYVTHRGVLENRWRFLPKTAILLDADFQYRSYSANAANNLMALRVYAGLTGLLSEHFALTAKLGYGRDLTLGSFQSLIGQIEAGFLINEGSSIKLGVLRTFEPVVGSAGTTALNTYEDNRAYLEARATLFSRLILHGNAAVDALGYKAGAGSFLGGSVRNDLVLTFDVGADVEITKWFIAGLGDTLTSRSSSETTGVLNFTGNQVYARLTFTY